METILTQYYQSPYGELLLGSFGDKLCLCDWMLNEKRRVPVDKRIRQALHADYEEGTSEVIARAIIQLDEYFACKRTIFDVPLLAVGTEFQRTVWQELQNIITRPKSRANQSDRIYFITYSPHWNSIYSPF